VLDGTANGCSSRRAANRWNDPIKVAHKLEFEVVAHLNKSDIDVLGLPSQKQSAPDTVVATIPIVSLDLRMRVLYDAKDASMSFTACSGS
jgi:hypothetical protein